ncbi:MAG: hypothetical protein GWN07_12830, partial [Actinobacteria bacterium]|nr:hypothetical protein [Actinomycetota bacterium]NIU66348.1 hypothetical protein [Actinomycetota bacterium]NIW30135.1 hypothetical protein [Actinomycetota bacterium]NIX20659.1 hypothetical protein [Actinomycetota bacterium]
ERLGSLVETRRGNAALAWLLVVFVASVVVGSVLVGDLLWAGFAAAVGVLALIPSLAHRDPQVMLPWEVLALAA